MSETPTLKEVLTLVENLDKFSQTCRISSIEELNSNIESANNLLEQLAHEREKSNEPTYVRMISRFRNRTLRSLITMQRIRELKQVGELPNSSRSEKP